MFYLFCTFKKKIMLFLCLFCDMDVCVQILCALRDNHFELYAYRQKWFFFSSLYTSYPEWTLVGSIAYRLLWCCLFSWYDWFCEWNYNFADLLYTNWKCGNSFVTAQKPLPLAPICLLHSLSGANVLVCYCFNLIFFFSLFQFTRWNVFQ